MLKGVASISFFIDLMHLTTSSPSSFLMIISAIFLEGVASSFRILLRGFAGVLLTWSFRVRLFLGVSVGTIQISCKKGMVIIGIDMISHFVYNRISLNF